MNLENGWIAGNAKRLSGRGLRRWRISLLAVLLACALVCRPTVRAQVFAKRNVLILNEVGLSHSLTDVLTLEIVGGVERKTGRNVEFFSESLDLLAFPDRPSLPEMRDWLAKKYNGHNLEVVVAAGPGAIKFVADNSRTLFLGVPIVICGSTADQAGYPNLDSRFTGTWQKREPGKTFEAALRLFPDTRHVFVVGGTSVFDRVVIASTKEFFSSAQTKVEFSYLTDMEMKTLLEQLKNLPKNSIVFYTSFFQDSAGNRFLNATQALPMIASAANAPVFGMSDTYLGHGIVGGDLMNFREQGKVTARIVSELLEGKKAEELPIETLPTMFMFDWNELKRWHVSESRLPVGSMILFREPSVWERTKQFWAAAFLMIVFLSASAAYLQYSRKQLKLAEEGRRQLSGMLINAEEHERQRVASELHDDFSQRLAILALGLENVEEATPASLPEVHEHLRALVRSASDLGIDLHTLSHRLHSSTLESLGLVPAGGALCKEFTLQQGIGVNFTSDEIPRSVHPDAALCVFRIVQEALRNVKKYADAGEAEVELRMTADGLDVTVRDKGRGFDWREIRQNEGLGIRSMEERARSLGGKFTVHSEPDKGTTVYAWVPLNPESGLAKS
jgi:signal transduction histidine kinase